MKGGPIFGSIQHTHTERHTKNIMPMFRIQSSAATAAIAHSALFSAILLICPLVLQGATPHDTRTVSVLYAGSLAGVMENGIGPAFTKATGITYQGEAQGSLGAAQMVRSHVRTPDIFISADPAVNENVLMGSQNGNLVQWYAIVASSQLVLAYGPNTKFQKKFEDAQAGKIPWYEVLETPGVHFGRGDPMIDPKGYRTLFLFSLASKYYQRPEILKLLGETMNPSQVFPEIVLLARVESGQFDAGIFYKHEAVAHKLPFVSLPLEVNLGSPKFAALYAKETYTTNSGQQVRGTPILFTVTIPATVQHRPAALEFVRFLLSSDQLLQQFGFGVVAHQIGGDPAQAPAEIKQLTNGVFKP
jgi:molybdate/tungstate transport system substrate-binding protein